MDIKIGSGATLIYPSDRQPYVVTQIFSPKCIGVARIEAKNRVVSYTNGFPLHDHVYTETELQEALGTVTAQDTEKAFLHKDGHYYLHGTQLSVSEARYRRDYSD